MDFFGYIRGAVGERFFVMIFFIECTDPYVIRAVEAAVAPVLYAQRESRSW